jgi:uncharacterized membrane protein
MATYKLNLRNPYTKTNYFNIKSNGGITKVKLEPYETKDLTEIHPNFTIQADSTTDATIGEKISSQFLSGGNLEVVMRDHLRNYDKNLRIRNRSYTDFFTLTT